jgi:hypothetical protein
LPVLSLWYWTAIGRRVGGTAPAPDSSVRERVLPGLVEMPTG